MQMDLQNPIHTKIKMDDETQQLLTQVNTKTRSYKELNHNLQKLQEKIRLNSFNKQFTLPRKSLKEKMILREFSSRQSENSSKDDDEQSNPEGAKAERKARIKNMIKELEKSVKTTKRQVSIESDKESSEFSFSTIQKGAEKSDIFQIPSSKVSSKKVN